ncbi:5-carboxymethyl-2-hydroxymuconate isomerase [Variovorax paradoxus]|jgi:5-carboxymethyl-2-hydroxymuconate isomerase|uniref:5-carboxymethyl-2-hydroxymuconate isomerase n=1 Tax=Variovorax paradoxus TaxID=34073 RepID=UPI00279358E1|nr:5-carboxymethyl-2-hydroxymuconate isomerase [Variovorax paradoxus]MDQ0572970.1 5-carboxymethyl-2-hydroxymuconate isomerase [Variovorax paradoxus]
MPHVTIQYTANLDAEIPMGDLCRALAATLVSQKDARGQSLFPVGGTRVLAYPAAQYAVADDADDYAFVYVNVRIAAGRSDEAKKTAGDNLLAAVRSHFEPIFDKRRIGITLQIDEGPGQVYDGKHSNLHPLFNK